MEDRPPPRSASAVPGKVVIDDKVRDFLERRSQSFRYHNQHQSRQEQSNSNTLPVRRRDTSEPPPSRRPSERIVSYDYNGDYPLTLKVPLPALMQNDPGRRTEMSSIVYQEEDRTSALGRPPPTEFYRSSRNKFKSLPITSKRKSQKSNRDKKPNFVVATFRWIRNKMLGKRRPAANMSRSTSQVTVMEHPSRPSHTRSLSLPRNTRFTRKRSSTRAEPPRVPASRSTEFPSVEHNYPSIRRSGTATQIYTGGNGVIHQNEEFHHPMNPLLKGFPNLGNSCYWNAVLQALGALEPIASYYLNSNFKKKNGDLTYCEEFTLVFSKLIEAMWKNQDGADHIRRMRQIYDSQKSAFGQPHEQDAHEFLISLITMLCRDAGGSDCFSKECIKVGLDDGTFKRNFAAIISENLNCCTCGYKAKERHEFYPFISVSLPGKNSHLIKFNVIGNLTKLGRVFRHSLYVNSKSDPCMTGTVKLISHQTGIPDNRLLLFQANSSSFSQALVSQYDFSRPRQQGDGDTLYVTELDREQLMHGYEVVSILFIHALNESSKLRRVTEPFKCSLGLNASYHDIFVAIMNASRPLIQAPRLDRALFSEFDILLHDDNEFEHRVLNPVAKSPLLAAHAARCMDDQTRILPNLPRFLRLVVRWKPNTKFLIPQNDSVVNHPSFNDFQGFERNSLDTLFAKYFAPEYMGDWKCDRCHSIGGVRTSWYSQPPNIIACSLKRFVHDSTNLIKIDKPASIPLERFDISRWTAAQIGPDGEEYRHREDLIYDMVSFMCHIGYDCSHGHYLAYSRSPVSNTWHIYDDNNVIAVNDDEVDTSQAYVIFLHNSRDRIRRQQQLQQAYRETGFFQSLRNRKKEREPLNMLPNGPLVNSQEISHARPNGSFRSDISRRRPSSTTRNTGDDSLNTTQNTLRPPSQSSSVFDRRSKSRASKETRI